MPKFEVTVLVPVTAYVEALNKTQAVKRGLAAVEEALNTVDVEYDEDAHVGFPKVSKEDVVRTEKVSEFNHM